MSDLVSAGDFKCIQCGRIESPMVTPDGLAAYEAGGLIQNCFPELSDDTREIMISNICGTCFDKIFEGDELAEDEEDAE